MIICMNEQPFDWNIAITRANGNKDLAQELSGLLIETIKECIPELQTAWQQKDVDNLIHLAHKMHGGAAYTGAIQVQHASKDFELKLKSGDIDTDSYEQFLKSMKVFSEFHESV